MRLFISSLLVSIAALCAAYLYAGLQAVAVTALLGVLEVSFSFDNAIVNATILKKMPPLWQKIFLTIGVIIAAFGMRFIFPLLIVWITAKINPTQALRLAFHPPVNGEPTYAQLVEQAHGRIAAFGGMFLLMLSLNFLTSSKEHYWIRWVEKPLTKLDTQKNIITTAIITVIAAAVLTIIEYALLPPAQYKSITLWGALGVLTYVIVNTIGDMIEPDSEIPTHNGNTSRIRNSFLTGLGGFLYLEVIDSSFSFDGVIGAFAITADPIIIMLGLGFIGAIFVRSITVFLVQNNTLSEFVYLEHGAHYAIGVLSVIMLVSAGNIHIPDILTGSLGVLIIGASIIGSILKNKHAESTANA